MRAALVLAAALAAGAPVAAAAQTAPLAVEIVAEYPAGTFLENLAATADGGLAITSYFAKTLERVEPDGKRRTLAMLGSHPVGIAVVGDGFIVTAHGEPFTSGGGFTWTQHVLRLDAQGRELQRFPAPDARFLNGVIDSGDGGVLIADSIAATIWRLDLASGRMSPWLQDPLLSRNEAEAQFRPGANGIRRADGARLVSNSSRGTLIRVPLDAAGRPVGPPARLATVGSIDDFSVEADGGVVFAT
ncbi:MAG: hypothetical protein ACRCTI_08290, partial [Beijerinckiaceae bacterium]